MLDYTHVAHLSAADVERLRAVYEPLARSLRELIDATIRTEADADVVATATAEIRSATERLRASQRAGSFGIQFGAEGDPMPWGNAVIGVRNPTAPPLVIRRLPDGSVRSDFHLGAAFEGPPGHVHGGYVAAAFDEVLGLVQSLSGAPGMTANLTVRYRRPTPLYQPLVFVGRLARVEGRKVYTTATLHAGETLCAESEGLFISIDRERFERMAAERDGSAT